MCVSFILAKGVMKFTPFILYKNALNDVFLIIMSIVLELFSVFYLYVSSVSACLLSYMYTAWLHVCLSVFFLALVYLLHCLLVLVYFALHI